MISPQETVFSVPIRILQKVNMIKTLNIVSAGQLYGIPIFRTSGKKHLQKQNF